MSTTITFEKAVLGFAAALKKIRTEKGLTQGDLFRRTGFERAYLSRLEQGHVDDPRVTTVIVLARALGVTVEDFIGEMLKAGEARERERERLSKKK